MSAGSIQGYISQILSGAIVPLAGIPPNLINVPVSMFVPNQGMTQITLLEAAIIARNPVVVQQLLGLGANPNITTAGVPLVQQLLADPTPDPATQAIIGMLGGVAPGLGLGIAAAAATAPGIGMGGYGAGIAPGMSMGMGGYGPGMFGIPPPPPWPPGIWMGPSPFFDDRFGRDGRRGRRGRRDDSDDSDSD